MLNIQDLLNLADKPFPYEPGAELWNDDYIAKSMLTAHLSPDTDAASYRPQKIDAICDYLAQEFALSPDASIVDLGCGPGLYANRFAAAGFRVMGVDRSHSSITYAQEQPSHNGARFVEASYLEPFGSAEFDAALMVSEDYGVLSPQNRVRLLANIHTALKPKGQLALDVSSLAAYAHRKNSAAANWSATQAGFWRGHPHAVLEKTFFYDEIPSVCDFFAVLDTEVTVYRIYQTFFTPESLTAELARGGFEVKAVLSSLWGEPYSPDAHTLAVLCEKV